MKINVEFNTVEEMKEFADLIGTSCKCSDKTVIVTQNEEKEVKKDNSKVDKRNLSKKSEKAKSEDKPKMEEKLVEEIKEQGQEIAPKVEAETMGGDETQTETVKDAEFTEEVLNITKEQLREICAAVMKSGKQSEVKEVFKKYGASKLPELKEKDYASAYKDVEALQ